jgi:hypothetical protein
MFQGLGVKTADPDPFRTVAEKGRNDMGRMGKVVRVGILIRNRIGSGRE